MDGRGKSYSREASASQDSVRMEVTENENWTTVNKVYANGPPTHSQSPVNDATTSYSTNREKVYHKNARTIEETHVLESSGRATKDFAEEHWSSEIKSYVTPQPPKFIQVIKAFRVLATDTLTLVVEVHSEPPAIFEWFCNDKPVQQDRRRFKARHGINITTLTVEGPEQGVYKCTARNPAGISTTYGYVTVNAVPSYKTWLEQKHEVLEETKAETVDKENIQIPIDVPPKFIHQIPNLTLRPGIEAIIDVEVEASPPAKFTWYVNGVEFRDTFGQIEVYYPMANRCIARFPIPQTGEYKVVAENRAGKERSIGYIDIKKEVMYRQTHLPPLPNDHVYHRSTYTESEHREIPLQGRGRASSVTRTVDVYEESSYYQRSTSLPRQTDRPYEIKKTTEIIRKRRDVREESYEFIPDAQTIPAERPPQIISPIQPSVFRVGEPLKLRCRVDGLPRPEVFWTKDEIRIDEWVMEKEIITRHYPDGTCELINPECAPEDAGLYQLTARNIHGSADTSAYIHVEREETIQRVTETRGEIQVIHRAPSKPRFSEILSKQYEHETVVSCKVISETPVLISWYKDGQRLYQSYKYRMQKLSESMNTLTIYNFDKWDEGTYICRAENEYGSTETGIYIRPPTETRAVSEEILIEESTDEVVGLRENIDYIKKAYTDTTIKITTEPEVSGSQEMYSHTAELRKSEEEYKLLVKVAEIVASKLVAKVIIDEAIHVAMRRMYAEEHSSEEEEFETILEQRPCPPRFETNIECYTVDVGDTVVLRTDIAGYPQPYVEWYFGEQKLEQSEQIDVQCINGRATLTIKRVEKKQEGTYYCHAENEYGKAVLSCYLRVTDISGERAESTYRMIRPPLTYTLSETEAEVSSNVHVSHAAESYEHHFAVIQPEIIALGYSCIASTSKVYDDSVIITRETVQRAIEREQEIQVTPSEAYAVLNVNVERAPAHFTHDARIIQSADESVAILRHEPRFTRTEEIIQASDILLIEQQRVVQQRQSTVNATTTIVLEKPPQLAFHEVTCLYDEKMYATKEKVQTVGTVDLKKVEMVNELISTIMATKGDHEAHAEANVDVRRPDAIFDHFVTVVESEREHLELHLVAPMLTKRFVNIDLHLQQRQEQLKTEAVYIEQPKKHATAEQRIVILESLPQKFSEAITWSLKKIHKESVESSAAATHATVEVYKPEEIGEHTTTIVDTVKIVPELLAIAAAASKLKITSVFVTFTKKGDIAHQALVIEYESFVEDEATLNVTMLTAPGFHSKQEDVWSYAKKYEKTEETETNVVAVFVEVDATAPDQTVELIASVSLPPAVPGTLDATRSAQSLFEASSVSWSESSSTGLLQAPRFIKTLENTTGIIGQSHQFKCIVSGTPAPMIRWYVDGDMIHDSDVYQKVYEDGVCILKIRELAIEDEGEYTCEATNDAGRAITKCFMRTITEADALKYQQQAMYENTLCSSNGNNTNSMVFWDSISSFNGSGVIYRNPAAADGEIVVESDTNLVREPVVEVDYEFLRSEPSNAGTTAIVTRYTSPQKGFHKNFASEERSFNVSVFLPNAVMECDFVWVITVSENIELRLMSPTIQKTDFVIQIGRPQQAEEAQLLLSVKRSTYETISFALCQPWEEILLLKRPENAFISDNEFHRMQQVRLQTSIESADNTGYSNTKNQLVKSFLLETDCFSHSLHSYVDIDVERDDPESTTSLTVVQANPPLQVGGSFSASKTEERTQSKEKFERKDEQKQPRIPNLPQKVTYKGQEVDVDIVSRSDGNEFEYEILRKKAQKYPHISANSLAAIQRYVDALLDFGPAMTTIISDTAEKIKLMDVNEKSKASDLTKSADSEEFIINEYLNCSFCRESEYDEAIKNRSLPVLAMETLTLSGDHTKENLLAFQIDYVELDPNSKENKKPYKEENVIPSPGSVKCEGGCGEDEISKQCINNLENHQRFQRETKSGDIFNMSVTHGPGNDLGAERDPMHTMSSAEGTDDAAFYDASEEFEVFGALSNSDPQTDENIFHLSSINPSVHNPRVIETVQPKIFHENPGITLTSDFGSREEKPSTIQGSAKDEILSRIRAIDEVAREVEAELEVNPQSNEEALEIERAIYDISEQLGRQQLVTEAQAEANEELMKTILENIIMNAGPSSTTKSIGIYRKPIALLREKLTDLENTLMRGDLEFKEPPPVQSFSAVQSIPAKSLITEDTNEKSDGQESVRRDASAACSSALQQDEGFNKQEVARMTPLTLNIKEQLQKIETMLEEVDQEEESEPKELTCGATAIPVYTDVKQREVHNILMQINNEISVIKRYCHKNISQKSVDAAIGLLHKVRNNVSSMVELISVNKRRFRKKSPAEKEQKINTERMKSPKPVLRPMSPLSKTGFFFKNDASVNFYLVKPEELEVINAIVMLRSASDKSGNQSARSGHSEISTHEDSLKIVFDDDSRTSQVTCDYLPQVQVGEKVTGNERRLSSSVIIDPQLSDSVWTQTFEDFQATPVPPPRKRKEMSRRRANSPTPVPPPRPNRSDFSSIHPCNLEKDFCEEGTAFKSNQPKSSLMMDTVEIDVSAQLMPEQKLEAVHEIDINCERIIRKEGDMFSCLCIWPSKAKYRISLETFDESGSVQLICEDSDYAPERAVHSILSFEPTSDVQEESEEVLLQKLALLPNLNTTAVGISAGEIVKTEIAIIEPKEEEGEKHSFTSESATGNRESLSVCPVGSGLEMMDESSKTVENPRDSTSGLADFDSGEEPTLHFHVSSDTKPRRISITNPLEDDTSSLHEIESIDDKDEIFDEMDETLVICNPHASIIDNVDVLPTIMEGSDSSKNANSFMSISTNTVIAVGMGNIDAQEIIEPDAQKATVIGNQETDTLTPTLELTAKVANTPSNNAGNDEEMNYLDEYKKRVILIRESNIQLVPEETTVNITYKRCSNKLKVIAVLSPEVRAKAEASTVIGEDFDVLIEQQDEVQNFTIKIIDHMSDSISLDLVLPNTIEVDLSLTQEEQCEGVLSYQVGNLSSGETDDDQNSITSYQDHMFDDVEKNELNTGISINIMARSMYDVARASLEEIPWGEVSMHIIMQPDMARSATDSEAKNSFIQNVTVSESNETEKRSLRSHESFRSSSQQSFDLFEFGDRYDSWQNLNVPSYMIKEGSTATITCEFNNFLTPGSIIDWFKGKSMMEIVPGKTDRISHDLLEVLVISQVDATDGDIYSIRVNDIVYPVACLIVEDIDVSSEKIDNDIRFLSPPQTLFVMEGQPSIISCQVSSADQKVEWCKDNKKWVTENERIRLESDRFGYHRIVIDKSELEDQGTYYAFLGDHFTTVTLVVEERIDEREVTINASGTDTDEDDYREYLVPLGSTATIACELENSDEVRELVWRKDGARIKFTDDAKVEHVVNGLKHYLVIHDTQADDSACYSVCINDIEFKIAHLMVSDYATTIGSKHTKRISSTSLQ